MPGVCAFIDIEVAVADSEEEEEEVEEISDFIKSDDENQDEGVLPSHIHLQQLMTEGDDPGNFMEYLAKKYLKTSSSKFTPSEHTWIRVRKGRYHGDLAFVISVSEAPTSLEVGIVVMPCITYPSQATGHKRKCEQKGRYRPTLSLFEPGKCASGCVAIRDTANKIVGYSYQRREFDSEGWEIIRNMASHMYHSMEVITSIQELFAFKPCPYVKHHIFDQAMEQAESAQVKLDDKVWARLTVGLHIQEWKATVVDVSDREVTVRMRHSSQEVPLSHSQVRKAFSVGDSVQVVWGADKGKSGWVVGIFRHKKQFVTIFDHQAGNDFVIHTVLIDFYNREFRFTSKDRQELATTVVDALGKYINMRDDPYKQLAGLHVVICDGPEKGKQAIIKTVNSQGLAQIETQSTLLFSLKLYDASVEMLAIYQQGRLVPIKMLPLGVLCLAKDLWHSLPAPAIAAWLGLQTPAYSTPLQSTTPAWDPSSSTCLWSQEQCNQPSSSSTPSLSILPTLASSSFIADTLSSKGPLKGKHVGMVKVLPLPSKFAEVKVLKIKTHLEDGRCNLMSTKRKATMETVAVLPLTDLCTLWP
ncbi:hypothetical protein BDQ12DRAFT_668795 [Crucibulum laeve]|uniref:KOW domain-containing protein n=1 Tax=Crucibulum laeve TaxID=68775 RepID=A0A5C3LT40_9AGAR|nr:hypothetical protein BDQ12DRAFT_668795 [Crucibulum laeve]